MEFQKQTLNSLDLLDMTYKPETEFLNGNQRVEA